MVIIVSREGQLANRMLHASSFIVNAKEHNYKVRHLFFNEYYGLFSEALSDKKNVISFWGRKSTRLVSILQRLVTFAVKGLLNLRITKLPFFELVEYKGYEQGAEIFDLNREDFVRKAKSKIVLVHGWLFRDPVNIKKHRSLLLETWQPNQNYVTSIEKYFQRYKKDHDILIGVHIRGGDYKKFEGGKWFYTPDQYYDKMREVASLDMFRDKKISFVICTNEKNISLPGTAKFSLFYDERHFVEDIYLLSKCDYIMGPPSTFSVWASFYGNVPLFMIKDISHPITEEIFKKNAVAI